MVYDIAIIGTGAAGYTAAIYAARYKLKTLVIGKQEGGMTATTHEVGNWPGIKMISGPELMKNFKNHALSLGAQIINAEAVKIEKKNNLFELNTREKKMFQCKSLILAMGTEKRHLDIPGESEFFGKGVSYCATCDGFFFKEKTVAVIGGSDSAAVAALYLADLTSKVFIIYRRNALRAEAVWVDKVKQNKKIEIIYNTNVIEIKGKRLLEKIVLDNEYNGKKELMVEGVFIEAGVIPGAALVEPMGVSFDDSRYIIVDKEMKTNVDGVFAAGDITTASNKLKQISTAVGEAAVAATSSFKWIKTKFKG